MLKTLFLHQYLQYLGLDNLFSHRYKYKKTFQIFFLFSKFGGHPYTGGAGKLSPLPSPPPSDMPCKLIIFSIEKSLHEFFFKLFWCMNFFLFSLLDFYFCSPPPYHFSNGPPLKRASPASI